MDRSATVFEYDRAFFKSGVSLNPFWRVDESAGAATVSSTHARRLHGVFADSLPDAWGRAVLRRRLGASGVDFEALSPVRQLQIIGMQAHGALAYEPAEHDAVNFDVDLDDMAQEANALLDGGSVVDIAQLAVLAGSSGGARPKLLVDYHPSRPIRAFDELRSDGDNAWIVKLPSRYDLVDIGPLEAAYADMARAAGLEVAPTLCLPSNSRPFGYFATKRFDRSRNTRRHFTSIAGLLDFEWSEPSLSYADFFKAVRYITKSQSDVVASIRRMMFNVASHNRDDHGKQHAFFHDFHGNWSLTPSYDLTYAPGPGGEHYLTVCGRGKDITRNDVLTEASQQRISKNDAQQMLDEVLTAVSNFLQFADCYKVSEATRSLVHQAIERCVALLR